MPKYRLADFLSILAVFHVSVRKKLLCAKDYHNSIIFRYFMLLVFKTLSKCTLSNICCQKSSCVANLFIIYYLLLQPAIAYAYLPLRFVWISFLVVFCVHFYLILNVHFAFNFFFNGRILRRSGVVLFFWIDKKSMSEILLL